MKTLKTLYILAALLLLQTNVLSAANTIRTDAGVTGGNEAWMSNNTLAPSTPAEATFEEWVLSDVNVALLAPARPAEADFSDEAPAAESTSRSLAPVTPKVADFEESLTGEQVVMVAELAPVTPVVAEFEE